VCGYTGSEGVVVEVKVSDESNLKQRIEEIEEIRMTLHGMAWHYCTLFLEAKCVRTHL